MKARFNYHCIQCNSLILASNTPQDIPATCWKCEHEHTKFMISRMAESINVDDNGKHRGLYKNIKKKKYKKCHN